MMKRLILMGCFSICSLVLLAQGDTRIASGTPLRWGMNGSLEVMEGNLSRYYGSADSATAYRRNLTSVASTPWNGNPHATRFASVQALCSHNAIQINWVAVQQQGARQYEVEQSTDGRNWQNIGIVPANQFDIGDATYNYTYNRNIGNGVFRIVAINLAGERVTSAPFGSPCGADTYLGVNPNPVYSTTTIRIGSPGTARVKLLLVDSKGVVLQGSDATLVRGTNHIPIDMSRLPAGYYTLLIRWNNGRQESLNLVKQ